MLYTDMYHSFAVLRHTARQPTAVLSAEYCSRAVLLHPAGFGLVTKSDVCPQLHAATNTQGPVHSPTVCHIRHPYQSARKMFAFASQHFSSRVSQASSKNDFGNCTGP
jgi:hypothetical protein